MKFPNTPKNSTTVITLLVISQTISSMIPLIRILDKIFGCTNERILKSYLHEFVFINRFLGTLGNTSKPNFTALTKQSYKLLKVNVSELVRYNFLDLFNCHLLSVISVRQNDNNASRVLSWMTVWDVLLKITITYKRNSDWLHTWLWLLAIVTESSKLICLPN